MQRINGLSACTKIFGSKKTNLSELALNLHEAIQFITILFQSKTVCKFLFYLFGHSQ